MTSAVHIAVVGLGGWGPNLLRNAASVTGVRVCAICDRDPHRLEQVGELYPGIDRCADYGEVLAREDVDAVILATPAGLHFEQARAALQASKHALVEKPLALRLDEGRELVSLARQGGLVLMTGHTFLYNGAVLRLRDLVAEGQLGRVFFVNAERMSLGKVREDVNAMWNLSPHDFSILNFLLGGKPARVRATGGVFLPGARLHDIVSATLEYPCGAVAHVLASWLNPLKVRRMTIVGERKMLLYDDVESDAKLRLYDRGVESTPQDDPSGSYQRFRRVLRTGSETLLDYDRTEPLHEEIRHFADCIAAGRQPRTGTEESLAVLEVLEVCQASLERDGLPLDLTGTPAPECRSGGRA